jgi:predicted site-specific integrase-resolvase
MDHRRDARFETLAVDQRTAAEMLGVSVSTLRRWHREGRGPRVVRLSRLTRYRPEDLRRFLRSAERAVEIRERA